jgi:hypothetical protein
MRPAWLVGATLFLTASCTYGPPEDRAVAHALRVPDTRTFLLSVHHERFRPPTGLSAFPDGGTTRTLLHELRFYRADAESGTARLWASMPAPRRLWSAFSVSMVGAAPDTLYAALSGCPGNECWGDLRERVLYRVTAEGAALEVDSVPVRHRPGGGMEAPRPGEVNYMRIGSIHRDSITVRMSYPAEDRRTLFRILPAGELVSAVER